MPMSALLCLKDLWDAAVLGMAFCFNSYKQTIQPLATPPLMKRRGNGIAGSVQDGRLTVVMVKKNIKVCWFAHREMTKFILCGRKAICKTVCLRMESLNPGIQPL